MTKATLLVVVAAMAMVAAGCGPQSPYARWSNGLSTDPGYFPIGVWLQSPDNAPKFQALGINLYIGQFKGPTEEDLAGLRKHGMKVICDQNEVGLKHKDDPIIVGWMHGDEPDNCKKDAEDKWIPVAKPEEIIADYQRMKANDPTRPVYLNLGCKVADDRYKGSWVGDHEEYVKFLRGCDIVSYDIYPAKSRAPYLKGMLHYVPLGVDRLCQWAAPGQIVWAILEGSPTADGRPSPEQLRAEVWMSLIHGATGIIYFVHQFSPEFIEPGLLSYPETAEAVGRINRQVRELAPVLNSPTVEGVVGVTSRVPRDSEATIVPIDIMVKQHGGDTYVFAVAMRDGPATATFHVKSVPLERQAKVEVIGEERTIGLAGGVFKDEFKGYGVHLYRLAGVK